MKKIALLLTVVFSLFASNAFAMRETVTDTEKISYVISEYYPSLAQYYEEGLIQVASLTEETLLDGDTEYNVRYRFVNVYCQGKELDDVLVKKYPNEYILYKAGMIKDVSVIKYVDRDTGEIETHLAYNWVFQPRRPSRHFRMHR